MGKRFNTNGFRLFLKGLVTAWVPVAIVMDAVAWTPDQTALVMAASVFTIDGAFWVFGVGDRAPAIPKK